MFIGSCLLITAVSLLLSLLKPPVCWVEFHGFGDGRSSEVIRATASSLCLEEFPDIISVSTRILDAVRISIFALDQILCLRVKELDILLNIGRCVTDRSNSAFQQYVGIDRQCLWTHFRVPWLLPRIESCLILSCNANQHVQNLFNV